MSTARANGKVLPGQQFNPNSVIVIPFTEQVINSEEDLAPFLGADNTEIVPIDGNAWKVTVFDLTEIDEAFDAVVFSFPIFIQLSALDLPNELVSVEIDVNLANGVGGNSHPGTNQFFYFHGSGSGSLSPRSSAQGSASILLDAQPVIKYRNQGKVAGTRYTFYMAENFTTAQLLTRLTALAAATVLMIPVFHPVSHTLTLKGVRASVAAEASSQVAASDSPNNYSGSYEFGKGSSQDVDVSSKTVVIPPTIHPSITLATTSHAEAIVAVAVADTVEVITTNLDILPITNVSTAGLTITATVTPTTLAATTPTAVPTSGLYCVDLDIRPFEFNRVQVSADVIDFSLL